MTSDPMMARIMAAIADHEGGEDGRRGRFAALWAEIGEDGDPLHRCTLAHYMADLQADAGDSLTWNRRSLEAAEGLTDERLRELLPALSRATFLPSLHLNLAEDHHRLDDAVAARHHLALAEAAVSVLPEGGYGAMIRRGIARLSEQLSERAG